MEEHELTPKQRKWLEASRKIGPGPMTKTERQTLERLYTDMLPREQQELQRHIQEKFAKAQAERDAASGSESDTERQINPDDPTSVMERRVWSEPSPGLKKALTKPMNPRQRSSDDKS